VSSLPIAQDDISVHPAIILHIHSRIFRIFETQLFVILVWCSPPYVRPPHTIPTHHISAFFSHTVWELPHNTTNITYFGNLYNINYSHTLPTSLQLHHYTTIGPPSYISSRLVYICITQYNRPLFLLICMPAPPPGAIQHMVEYRTLSHFCPFDREVF
jgi:hypothetical protein